MNVTAFERDSLDDAVGDREVLNRSEQTLRLKHAAGAVVVGGVNVRIGVNGGASTGVDGEVVGRADDRVAAVAPVEQGSPRFSACVGSV